MSFFIKKALQDMKDNTFLHVVTMLTIAVSILILSAAGLLFSNAGDVIDSWKKGIRIMAYLKDNALQQDILSARQAVLKMNGVDTVVFISKDDALTTLKKQMVRQSSLIENLRTNPLPDAFEIKMKTQGQNWEKIEMLAAHIESHPTVTNVEYGQTWLGRISKLFSLFQFIAFAMGSLFFMGTVFIVANTIRLALFSRREEIEIMRLVGATNGFIKAPSYIAAIIQGAVGGLLGIIVLYITFLIITTNIEQNFSTYTLSIRFLSFEVVMGILCYSTIVGWLGCFLSLKQFLKA